LKVSVPATSANLGPGFDTLGLAINLRNEAEIKPSKTFKICIKGQGEGRLESKNNLFVKIFNQKFQNLTGEHQEFSFDFTNNIPLARGLGSSSACIVSAVSAAYKMAEISFDKDLILNEALEFEGHPDNITPAVFGGFCVAALKNKKIIKIKSPLNTDYKAVMVVPNKSVSTKQSRAVLKNTLSLSDAVFNISHSSLLTAAFIKGEYSLLKDGSQDLLHQNQRMETMPVLFDVQKKSLDIGALMCTLSGSGSSIFSLFEKNEAKKAKEKLASNFPEFFVEAFDFDNSGLIIK